MSTSCSWEVYTAGKKVNCQGADVLLQGQTQVPLTCIQLHKKAERIAAVLTDKAKLNSGQPVALLFPPGLDLIAAFYGCLYAGKLFYCGVT